MSAAATDRVLGLYRTTVGKKAVMAVTGAILFGFVVVHMIGNLQIYLGAEAIHAYAVKLRAVPGLLFIARAVLLAAVVLHIAAAVALAGRNSEARPVRYRHARRDVTTTYAARTMVWGGAILVLFIVYHLLHLTLGYGPYYDPQAVYNNVVYGFLDWRISTFYIVAQLFLGLHLWHGGWAWFGSLGLASPRFARARRAFATGLAVAVVLGNVAIPLSVMAGVVQPTTETFCAPELGECPGEVP
jgi:succinate dehydrogenase / fumarate reductase cytochrome b subunit